MAPPVEPADQSDARRAAPAPGTGGVVEILHDAADLGARGARGAPVIHVADRAGPQLTPDRAEAESFIAALAGSADAEVTFQAFDDDKKKRPGLARVLHGTLEQHW